MKKLINRNEVFYSFINSDFFSAQTRSENIFYSCDVIYSYGYHYVMGIKLQIDGHKIMLINNDVYSVTTAKHCRELACFSLKNGFEVYCIDNLKVDHKIYLNKLVADLIRQSNDLILECNKFRSEAKIKLNVDESMHLMQLAQIALNKVKDKKEKAILKKSFTCIPEITEGNKKGNKQAIKSAIEQNNKNQSRLMIIKNHAEIADCLNAIDHYCNHITATRAINYEYSNAKTYISRCENLIGDIYKVCKNYGFSKKSTIQFNSKLYNLVKQFNEIEKKLIADTSERYAKTIISFHEKHKALDFVTKRMQSNLIEWNFGTNNAEIKKAMEIE